MISSAVALLLAVHLGQASDTTRAAREAFTACLRTYVDQSLNDQTTVEAFQTAYPQQCGAQEAAFRDAVIRRETSARASRADAEQAARDEIEDARTNFRERFEMAMQPQA